MTSETDFSFGAITFRQNDGRREYLLVKHRTGRHGRGGHWDFPKGHSEGDESPEETAVREVKEETNIDITFIEGFRHQIHYRLENGTPKTVTFFLARAKNEEIRPQEEEIERIEWVGFQRAEPLITYENSRDALRQAEDFIINGKQAVQ